MSINPKMWDDPDFVSLSVEARLFWTHLLTAYNGGVPGLIQGGISSFAEAMRYLPEAINAALDALIRIRFVEYDQDRRLLRIPTLPKYRKPGNGNVLKGWLRRWNDLPESPLKYRHIDSLYEAGEGRKWFPDAWEETFELIKVPENTKQVPLFRLEVNLPENRLLEGGESNRNDLETISQSFPRTHITPPANISTNNTSCIKEKVLSLANTLWLEQEDSRSVLRGEGIGEDTKPLNVFSPAKKDLIDRINEKLQSGGTLEEAADDCRHVLDQLASEARRKKTAKWINGGHWKAGPFYRVLGLGVDEDLSATKEKKDSKYGRVEPMEIDDYPENGRQDW